MGKILKKYSEALLITLALVFLAVIVGGFVWGIGNIFAQLNRSIGFSGATSGRGGFDLSDAQKLDLHGLVGTSTTP